VSLRARLRARFARRPPCPTAVSDFSFPLLQSVAKILVVVEGPHDIEFLRRMSATLHVDDPSLPDLDSRKRKGELIFVPFGGGDLWLWVDRLAPLQRPEFHLYDRESPPETELRRRAAAMVNMRPGCAARLTAKRSLENYLHPAAIEEASGFEIQVSDDCDVADLLARQSHLRQGGQPPWEELPRGTHKRRRNRVKKWLVTKATDRMTPERLAERDPKGEVASWLKTITELAQTRH
jgi:putative ATP-dependent endonuclease of OLD family